MNKTRSDSISSAIAAAQGVTMTINPPAHVKLRKGDRPFWESVVAARAKSTWNNADLENAANLARCKADIERLQAEIDEEGDVIVNGRGTQILNPKHSLLETLSRRAVTLSRMLHVHAEATTGESSQAHKAMATQVAAEAAETDDLIPRLRAVG